MLSDYILVALGAVIGGAIVLACELAWSVQRERRSLARERLRRFADVDALARARR